MTGKTASGSRPRHYSVMVINNESFEIHRSHNAGKTLVVIALVGIMVHWWVAEPAVWLSSSSPDQTYKVELTGDKGRGGFFVPAVVKYNLIKNGHLLAKNRKAHSGNAMDISFEIAYPEHTWISENVIRFWRNESGAIDDSVNKISIS